jgi:hypothetical protein
VTRERVPDESAQEPQVPRGAPDELAGSGVYRREPTVHRCPHPHRAGRRLRRGTARGLPLGAQHRGFCVLLV